MKLELAIATPALWYPGQDEQEWKHEIHCMIQRSIATRRLLEGDITLPDFLDLMEHYGIEMDPAITSWTEDLARL